MRDRSRSAADTESRQRGLLVERSVELRSLPRPPWKTCDTRRGRSPDLQGWPIRHGSFGFRNDGRLSRYLSLLLLEHNSRKCTPGLFERPARAAPVRHQNSFSSTSMVWQMSRRRPEHSRSVHRTGDRLSRSGESFQSGWSSLIWTYVTRRRLPGNFFQCSRDTRQAEG